MSNSPLVVYTKLSPNHSGKRTKKIDTITIHCMAGNCSVETWTNREKKGIIREICRTIQI